MNTKVKVFLKGVLVLLLVGSVGANLYVYAWRNVVGRVSLNQLNQLAEGLETLAMTKKPFPVELKTDEHAVSLVCVDRKVIEETASVSDNQIAVPIAPQE